LLDLLLFKSFYKVINKSSSAGSVLGLPVDEWELIGQGLNPSDAIKANYLAVQDAVKRFYKVINKSSSTGKPNTEPADELLLITL
jgi:hypothetical protein